MYKDRIDAGLKLAECLGAYRGMPEAVVLGLPRGGVPVAKVVADHLGLPLDIFVVRKLGVPWHKEVAMGAVAEGGFKLLNRDYIDEIGVDDTELDEVLREETRELKRREQVFRRGRQRISLSDKVILVIDDGLATGATMKVAIAAIRTEHPRKVVVGVPVSPTDTASEIKALADEFFCPEITPYFWGVGGAYESFPQLSDEQVTGIMLGHHVG
jgi:predicted phosphoribosyltransferase